MSRNVEKLAEILASGDHREDLELAAYLAARGVLAVDSLTDEQACEIGDGYYLNNEMAETAKDVRAALRRCATGDAE